MYNAIFTALSTFASAAALLIAGEVVERATGLQRYLWLIGAGSFIGLVGIIVMRWIPGGAPDQGEGASTSHFANMLEALRNPNLAAYLRGMGGIMVGSVLLTSFLPLYLKEQLGLPAGTVVILDTVVMVGGALSSILWGWAADRIGSRPVLLFALGGGLLVPLGWLFLPRQVASPVIWCGLLYFLYGVISNGSAIGAGRLLFNGVVPQEKSTSYMAIYYAWMGLTGGVAPLLAGGLLSFSAGMRFQVGSVPIDGYTLLFFLSLVLLVYGLLEYRRVAPDDIYSTRAAIRKLLSLVAARRHETTGD
jgi:MFS family permease